MKQNAYLIFSALLLILGCSFLFNKKSEAQVTMNHWEPWNVQTNYLRTTNLPVGSATDSIVVKLSNGWFGRVGPTVNYVINSAVVGLSKAQLNSAYPNVPVGYLVLCPSITLGGAVYIKATEAGASDVWQTISAPPTP